MLIIRSSPVLLSDMNEMGSKKGWCTYDFTTLATEHIHFNFYLTYADPIRSVYGLSHYSGIILLFV